MKLILGSDTKKVSACKTFKELLEKASSVFERHLQNVAFYYVDSDGDIISISNESDYREALADNPVRMVIAQSLDAAKECLAKS
jgi:hypothetical protein